MESCTVKRVAKASVPAFVVSASMYESTVWTPVTEDHVTGTERETEMPLYLVKIPFFLKAHFILSSSTFVSSLFYPNDAQLNIYFTLMGPGVA